jgi:methionine synthase II (cobalamin-independent)
MDWDVRERVEALRREIAEIQKLNLAYLQMPAPDFSAMNDHARRDKRLKQIMEELRSMTDRKKP